MDIDINTFYDLQKCIDNKESRVFKGVFPDIFSVEEFNRFLNLRSFQTIQRLTPTKEVKKLTNQEATFATGAGPTGLATNNVQIKALLDRLREMKQ